MPIPRYVSEPSAPSWKSYAKKKKTREMWTVYSFSLNTCITRRKVSHLMIINLYLLLLWLFFFFHPCYMCKLVQTSFFFFSRITHSYIHYLQQLYNPFSRSCYVEDSVIRYSRAFSLSLSAAFKLSWIFSSLKPYSLKVFTNSRNSTAYNNIR